MRTYTQDYVTGIQDFAAHIVAKTQSELETTRFSLNARRSQLEEAKEQISTLENDLKSSKSKAYTRAVKIHDLEARLEDLKRAKSEQEQDTIHAHDSRLKWLLKHAPASLRNEFRREFQVPDEADTN